MKKLTKFFISMFLCLTCAFSGAACTPIKNNSNNSNSSSGEEGGEPTSQIELIKNARSNYTILVPEDPTSSEKTAAEMLKEYVFLSSSYSFTVKDDSEYVQGEKVISFGETAAYKNAGITVDKSTLNGDGFVIKVKDGNIFVIGGVGSNSYIYSTQRLLHELIDYEAYYYDEIAYKNYSNISFDKEMDIVDVPWASGRYMFNAINILSDEVGMSQQVLRENQPVFGGGVGSTHSIHKIVDPTKEEYAQYYTGSGSGAQPCFSNQGFREVLAENSIACIAQSPQATHFMIGQPDRTNWCTCDECAESLNHYGTNSAVLVKAINYVAEKVQQAIDAGTLECNPDIKITTFAYKPSEKPPVKKDDNGNWVPIDESVICRDNVCIRFAPIATDYYKTFYDAENEASANNLKGWGVLCKDIMVWNYNTNFTYYFVPFSNFNTIQDNYRFLKENNAQSIMEQGAYNSKQIGFIALKNYITSKYLWNTEYDLGEMMDGFFDNFYRDASANVRKYFEEYRAWTEHLCATSSHISGNVYARYGSVKDPFPLNLIDRWEGFMNDAKKDIEYLKDLDLELYNKIYDRIDMETLFFDYVRIFWNDTKYDSNLLRDMRIDFKNGCEHHGITHVEEVNGKLEDVYVTWGI